MVTITNLKTTAWSITDEAVHRGFNYADAMATEMSEAMRDGLAFHSILKQAYQDGFLHGFEHKFDQTNYEEKKDGDTLQG